MDLDIWFAVEVGAEGMDAHGGCGRRCAGGEFRFERPAGIAIFSADLDPLALNVEALEIEAVNGLRDNLGVVRGLSVEVDDGHRGHYGSCWVGVKRELSDVTCRTQAGETSPVVHRHVGQNSFTGRLSAIVFAGAAETDEAAVPGIWVTCPCVTYAVACASPRIAPTWAKLIR